MIRCGQEKRIHMIRCSWCGTDPLSITYHDEEWGVPVHDDRKLFEMLILEGAQAGLSWLTILQRRESYRRAFDGFDMGKIAAYGEKDIQRLLQDPGIIRNRLKIGSVIKNARGALEIKELSGTFDAFVWRYVDYTPKQNAWTTIRQIPGRTRESERMSKDLKGRGFNFVGPTICYAFMQAVGMVNDHTIDCFRYEPVKMLGRSEIQTGG